MRVNFKKVLPFIQKHKIASGAVVLIVLLGGYWSVSTLTKSSTPLSYALSSVTEGTLAATLTDSGQVSAEHQLSLSPKASGTVTSVAVSAGQTVRAGTIVATVDAQDANDAVRTAQQNLVSAQISYQQAVTSAETSTTNDQNTLRTQQTTTSNAIISAFTHLPSVMNGLDATLYSLSSISGYTAEQNLDAYANFINTSESRRQHDLVAQEYQSAVSAYQAAQAAYSSYNASSATAAQTETLATTATNASQAINTALRDTLTYLNYINDQSIIGGRTAPTSVTSAISSITEYLSTVTSDTTSIQSARTSLVNAEQSLTQDTQSLTGSSLPLSVQSAQLNLQKAQDSLAQARRTLENYVVRAPFDGTIASVSVKKFDQASSGTAVAVLITKENYVTLAVNEADASQIALNQKASITFDAIDGLTVDGTVAEVDQVGTVSQGVATYTVKVGFNSQDARIKPGMTAEATITTASAEDALQVPSAAVHTLNGESYVEVATRTASSTMMQNRTSQIGSSTMRIGSSTFSGMRSGTTNRSLTIPASEVKITRVPVTIGISNDTMVQITSGLTRGQLVVTGTSNGTIKSSTSSGSAFSLFGARQTTGAATNRTFNSSTRSTGSDSIRSAPPGGF